MKKIYVASKKLNCSPPMYQPCLSPMVLEIAHNEIDLNLALDITLMYWMISLVQISSLISCS